MNPLIQLTKAAPVFLVGLVLACFAIPQSAQAVVPAPDGGYPGGNTAEGQTALLSLTTGAFNTAVGFLSLRSNATGAFNTAIGAGALLANTAYSNTATGAGALLSNTTGSFNNAHGAFALFSNTTGEQNTANGESALFSNTTGGGNTANGDRALYYNTTGVGNTAVGAEALFSNTADSNTAVGGGALGSNTTGARNTATGGDALGNNTSGQNNIALGARAGINVTTASNVIAIGIPGNDVNDSCYIGNIFGATSSGGTAVFVNIDGRLGTMTSSLRFKEEIKPMERASEALFALKPVVFRYKKDIDPAGTPQLGLVAEEVEKVNPDLVVRDKEGKPYSVRYDAVNAMLLNEFLKEHRKVEDQDYRLHQQEATIAQQQKEFASKIALQQKQIAALTAGLQKVSAQLEASKPAPQVVNNN